MPATSGGRMCHDAVRRIMFFVSENDIVLDVGVLCNSEDITLTLTVTTDTFNGMIYPKGLSKNSTCMTEYIQQEVGHLSRVTCHDVSHTNHVTQHCRCCDARI